MTAPLVRVGDLRVGVPEASGRAWAVDRISFDLHAGERVGLVGESGAGKSLTALSLTGLLPRGVAAGPGSSIRVQGMEVVGASESDLRRIRGGSVGMVFQDPSAAMTPVRTVGAQLVEVLRLHRALSSSDARSAALELLADVGLPDPRRTFDDPPHRLSGGMRQRACIALAIAGDPAVLVADEPTTALDVTVQAHILDLLVRLSDTRGLALLMVSHDLAVVAQTCHRLMVMYAGRVVEAGPVDRVLAEPRHPYTRALLAARPRLDGPIATPEPIPGAMPTPAAWPSGCRFHPRCPERADPCSTRDPEATRDGDHSVACWVTGTTEPVP